MSLELNKIYEHLVRCSGNFIPPLETYVDIKDYSKKIYDKAKIFKLENNEKIVGLVAAYDNSKEKSAWITNVSVDPEYAKRGVATHLLVECFEYFKLKKYHKISLEVFEENKTALRLYYKHGFEFEGKKENKMTLKKELSQRNYDKELNDTEDHKYAYSFDFDVMHPYYLKAAMPYIDTDKACLELGSSKGHFTRRLVDYFDELVCVEASQYAIECAQRSFFSKDIPNKKITFINSLFENLTLDKKYNTIFLTHVLEHIENPIEVLSKIKNEWLADGGNLILICPNANAPSRQIAVKMGLISHNSAVTDSERAHGHHITYTLDTLERDVKRAGLDTIIRTGIFFKALANFQWDQILNTNIISKEYLDGCYYLGQQYPDLCSSIMFVCKK